MTEPDKFRIISVTGAHSSVGKTSLCALLLKGLENFGAIKFTKTPIYTAVIDDPDTIMEGDKDTAVMSRAGAERVVWIQSPGDELEGALDIALSKMHGLDGVVVEGNSPVDFINPHLVIFIIGKEGEIKQSAIEVAKKADIIVINSETVTDSLPFPSSLKKRGAEIFRIDLFSGKGETEGFYELVKKYV